MQFKILTGYVILMAVIGSMAAILMHEHKRIREIEAGTETIRQVRRDISDAHRRITRLALLGEGVVGWDETDRRHYHAQLLCTDSLLQAMKPLCREYVPGTDRHAPLPPGGQGNPPAAHHGGDGAAG